MPSPAAARRLPGATEWRLNKSATSRCPQNSAAISGVPPAPCASASSAAPFSISKAAISGLLAYAAAWSGVQPRSLASLTSAPAASNASIGDSAAFPIRLAGKADSEIQQSVAICPALVSQAAGCARSNASKAAASPDCSATKAAMNGSRGCRRPGSRRGGSRGWSGRPRFRSRAPWRKPSGHPPR